MTKIELLAPAKNLQIGIEAIKHGADAVYIGGPKFGARAAAGNSINEIKQLCDFAHIYCAKVYVTLNTIIYDNELEEVRKYICTLYEIGVDALIVQDLAICSLPLPPIEIHASTQLDVTSVEKVQLLEQLGFRQVVLARELSLKQIANIKATTNVKLEAFIHGALCVSYSGRCYASQYCFNRSANRGQCAQFCRLPFTLKDAEGRIIQKDKHLLSLRDMNRSESIIDMINAGITSFKIEGRLKDISYVKNVTAYYRKLIDEIIEQKKGELQKTSYGKCRLQFTPKLDKSFNRGFTEYFLHGIRTKEANIETPKSLGEYIGKISRITSNRIEVIIESETNISAGDGLCFVDAQGVLQGFRVNTVTTTNQKNKLFLTTFGKQFSQISNKIETKLFRNFDIVFEKRLEKETATRKLLLNFILKETVDGFQLFAEDETGRKTSVTFNCEHQLAKIAQYENIHRQLLKVGDTNFEIADIQINMSDDWFIPSSLLSTARRSVIQQLLAITAPIEESRPLIQHKKLNVENLDNVLYTDYRANIANEAARSFYKQIGANAEPAFEITPPQGKVPIMFCKYCLLHELGMCRKKSQHLLQHYTFPLSLHSADGRQFELSFNCKECEMLVWKKS